MSINGNYTEESKGVVYIMTNNYFSFFSKVPLIKIGFSCKNGETRRKVLSRSTAVPDNFTLWYECLTDSPYLLEQLVHRYLEVEKKRCNPFKEFFFEDIMTARLIIDSINEHIRTRSYMFPKENSEVTPYDIPDEQDYIFPEGYISPYSFLASFSFDDVIPKGLNESTWRQVISKIIIS